MMKLFTVRNWTYVFIAVLFFSCKDKGAETKFEIRGTITNNKGAKKVYLEELPAGGAPGQIVDSSDIAKDGKYSLKSLSKESTFYVILLDPRSEYPLATMINDVPKVTVDITLSDRDSRVSEKYDVKGSPATEAMREYVKGMEGDLQKISLVGRLADSLRKNNAPDSLVQPFMVEWKAIGDKIRDYSLASLNKANNPVLFIYELGAYEKVVERYGLEGLETEEEIQLVDKALTRFPSHNELLGVKKDLSERLARINKMREGKWVGKEAPDFSLPDANGKEIKLSSFRGKYLLVDFWASWCGPCRRENPNVVQAFNRFKDKNFAILGVSLDNPGEKDKWLKAVKKDNLNWTQVSDLKGWESIVVAMYDFGQVGIPYNILLDPDGIVIGERLQGTALHAKLEEVLK
jgi:peroxiredoxin